MRQKNKSDRDLLPNNSRSPIEQGRPQLTAIVQAAAIYSAGLGDMGQYVERFTAEQPFARVHVEYLHSNRVVEKV